MHALPAQHPLGHDIASQMHAPAMQRWPLAHIGPPPQVHAPPVHPSAPRPHETHETPPSPHAMRVGGATHVVPEQQPLGHEVALHAVHTPPAQIPVGQLVHAAPPVPHALLALPGMHTLPSQQPLGHDVGSQTQLPAAQRWPVAHAGPLPHVHAPLVEQPSLVPPLVQSTQLAPSEPQLEVPRGTHVEP